MKRSIIKAKIAERKVKRALRKKKFDFVEFFNDRMNREIKPLIVLD